MKYEVVDTNVLVVANGDRTQAGHECQVASAEKLLDTRNKHSLVLDTSMEILQEYQRQLHRQTGEPGPGHLFYNWVASSGDHRFVELNSHARRGFEAFPSDAALETFDWDDRKFVAAAIVSGRTQTRIINAVDSDYLLHQVALREAGVVIQELCPAEVQQEHTL